MESIEKDNQDHLKEINKAIRTVDIEKLSELMNNKSYPEDYLRKSFIQACCNGDLEIVQFLMTSKTFTPNQLSVRGVAEIFRLQHENIIHWLIFDYKMHKSGAIEEVLIEMGDKQYANHIEHLFVKRELNKNLENKLTSKDIAIKNTSFHSKI